MTTHLTQTRPGDHRAGDPPGEWNSTRHFSESPRKVLATLAANWAAAAGLGSSSRFPLPMLLTAWHRSEDDTVTTVVYSFRFDGTPQVKAHTAS